MSLSQSGDDTLFVQRFCCCFFNRTPAPSIYTLSLHDALPISVNEEMVLPVDMSKGVAGALLARAAGLKRLAVQVSENADRIRSEEHTSELQSHVNLVCRLLLEKKKEMKDFWFGDRVGAVPSEA